MYLGRSLIPDIAVLQVFETAARHGNFTKAAAELSLTQSAVSRQIKSLENQLGVLLFERVRKRVRLSSAGQQLLPSVRRILAESEEMVLRARSSSDGKTVLSIATLPTFGNRWLMPRLPDFLASHPGTTVEISSRSEPFDMGGENVDVAIHYGQPFWANANCTYLCSEVVVPVASPALIESATLQSPTALVAGPLLHLATRPKQWAEWFQMNGWEAGQAFHGNRFDQFSMVIESALRGMGVALLPTYLIEKELASGVLAIAFDLPLTTENSYFVVLPEGRGENGLARAFQDWMLGLVGKPVP